MTGRVLTPDPPHARLSIGVTGHREANPVFAAHRDEVATALAQIFDAIDTIVAATGPMMGETAPTTLNCLIADGVDELATAMAQARGWTCVSPLPFGEVLNAAVNALPTTLADAEALLAGHSPDDSIVAERALRIATLAGSSRIFALAEADDRFGGLWLGHLSDPGDTKIAQRLGSALSRRAALAGRVMIEQSDFIIAVWDGVTRDTIGGVGHTIDQALAAGVPVLVVDPADAGRWKLVRTAEALDTGGFADPATLDQLVRGALRCDDRDCLHEGPDALSREAWRVRSSHVWTSYRRIETLFGGGGWFRSLVQRYEPPDEIAQGSARGLMTALESLPGADAALAPAIAHELLFRFAWADGISARLSDAYRGSMTANFFLSALAVFIGIAYQPAGASDFKWIFASMEFALLALILTVISLGTRHRWHKRWFETRRVAEYLRHAPILAALGVARAPGRWPRGTDTSWPEYYARHSRRAVGLPRLELTQAYLREALERLLLAHVCDQRVYHEGKAARLTHVHHRLDILSGRLFQCAVASVIIYLGLAIATEAGLMSKDRLHHLSTGFTFLGVAFPTAGAAIAGIRYFGDFERFAGISEVTALKLKTIEDRLRLLLGSPTPIDYGRAADLAHAADEVIVTEIENWQSVFGGKQITIPA